MRRALLISTHLLIWLFIHPANGAAQAPQLSFSHILNEQGLSNSTIEAIYQDKEGFIWFGTRDGLNRYDGQEITSFKNDPADSTSLSDSYIRAIYEDRENNLWVATINGLNRLDRERNGFSRYKHQPADPASLSANLVTSMTRRHAMAISGSAHLEAVSIFSTGEKANSHPSATIHPTKTVSGTTG